MSRMNINGKNYDIPNGKKIEIKNGKVFVDGKFINEGQLAVGTVKLEVTGDIELLRCDGDVTMKGNVTGNASVGGDLECDTITGSVSVGGDLECKEIGGNAQAGGDIKASSLRGNAKAGGDVRIR